MNTAKSEEGENIQISKYIQQKLGQALALHQQSHFAQAKALYDEILQIQPDHFNALHLSSVMALQANDLELVVELTERAIKISPKFAVVHYNRGNALKGLKQYEAALHSLNNAIALKPDFADAYFNRGIVLKSLKQYDAALLSYEKAIECQPEYAEAYFNHGNLLTELKLFDAALVSFDKAISIKPDYFEAYNNRGSLLIGLKKYEVALLDLEKAITLRSDYADAYNNRGNLFKVLKQFEVALLSFDTAISLKPDFAVSYWNKALLLLLLGNFEKGWEEYEWRWRKNDPAFPKRNFTQELWLGKESLAGKTILLNSEQGLGDAIQFCRYAKNVADLGARVVLEVHKPLASLFTSLEGVSQLVVNGSALPEFDYFCPLLSLPLAFKTNLDNIPASIPYLSADANKQAKWKAKLGEKHKPRIGLTWSGSMVNNIRSIILSELLPHLPEYFQYCSLQKEVRDEDKETLRSRPDILHFGDELKDFSDTAALCQQMDLVISIDTSVAHLAGALGKQVWILLAFVPDWRWLLDRNDCPWYPTAKLYRQEKIGDWGGVLGRVKRDLLGMNLAKYGDDEQTRISKEVQQKLEQALALHQQGHLVQAKALYDEILKIQPQHFNALHLSGVIALSSNEPAMAIDFINRAIKINPQSAVAYSNLGAALKTLKQYESALQSYNKAITLNPGFADAYYNRGLLLNSLKQYEAALQSFDRVIALKPSHAEVYNVRGSIFNNLMQYEAALQSYDKAIALMPDSAEVFCNRGVVLNELKQYDDALTSFEKAISLSSDYAEAHYFMGNLQLALERYEAAQQSYDKAIVLKPDYADAYYARGNALKYLKKNDAALQSYERAIEIKPDEAYFFYNQGVVLRELGYFEAALRSYEKAILLKPDDAKTYWNKALLLLLLGNFEKGWEKYEWRWETDNPIFVRRNFTQPLWLGKESLIGKTILLSSEQGLGDAIQFCRYVNMLADLGARVVLEVPKPLLTLLANLNSNLQLIAKDSLLPSFDYYCPLLSLPMAFKTNLDNIPASIPYLSAEASNVAHWKAKLGEKNKLRIGFAWSGSTVNILRSILLSELLPYLPEYFQYVSLQKEVRDEDRETLLSRPDILHFGEELRDFSDTSAICENMDLVISIDTSVAHLAGALGKQVWILLPFVPDWRWLLERNDSPWYPTAKLFRQEKIGDWNSVLARLKRELLEMQPLQKVIYVK